jgi:iron(III) transport system substrate-binding protein
MKIASLIRTSALFAAVPAACLMTAGTMSASAWAQSEILVYTAYAQEHLTRIGEDFNKDHPDIKIKWLRPGSTGVVHARLLAEKDNPQADAVYAQAISSLIQLDEAGVLSHYKPAGYDELDSKFKDNANDPPAWVGSYGYMSTICYNTVLGKKKNIPMPTSWKDLLDPVYNGQIVMPSPNASGTGFISVSGWLQMFGEEQGWKFMDGLNENMAFYERSGSKPCVMAARGEFTVGISFATRGVREKKKGAPIEIISPSEGLGWTIASTALIDGGKNPKAAKKFADWSASSNGAKALTFERVIISRPAVSKKVEFYPDNWNDKLIENDFYWVVKNKKAILKEWTKRYDVKTIPKS